MKFTDKPTVVYSYEGYNTYFTKSDDGVELEATTYNNNGYKEVILFNKLKTFSFENMFIQFELNDLYEKVKEYIDNGQNTT